MLQEESIDLIDEPLLIVGLLQEIHRYKEVRGSSRIPGKSSLGKGRAIHSPHTVFGIYPLGSGPEQMTTLSGARPTDFSSRLLVWDRLNLNSERILGGSPALSNSAG